jgi:hypothetical protein
MRMQWECLCLNVDYALDKYKDRDTFVKVYTHM